MTNLKKGHRLLARLMIPMGLLTVLAMVGLGPPAQATQAGGTFNASLTGSTFNATDGDLTVEPGETDWNSPAPNLTIACDLASKLPNNNAGCFQALGQTVPTADNSFGQGTKSDSTAVTVVTGSIPPNKSDLSRFYTGNEFVGGNNFLYLAWERSNVLGSANMNFEIDQNATPGLTSTFTGPITLNRTAGDVLITFDFGGSGTPTLSLAKWVTSGPTSQCVASNSLPCWGNQVTLAGNVAEGSVNSTTVSDSKLLLTDPVSLPAGTFGEAAINLTAAGVFPPGTCKAFGSAMLSSRSSASFTAELKDFISPVPVNITNCGSIKIIKHTDPRGLNQVFSYKSNLPAEAPGPVDKVPQGGVACPGNTTAGIQSDGSFCLNDAGNSTADSAGNTVFTGQTLHPGTYTVTEGPDPNGFTFEGLSCAGGTTSTSGKIATITLAAGDSVVCTYVNQQNTATMTTQVSNAGPVFPGAAVHDTAAVTGSPATAGTPSGTVTFFLCGPIPTGSCSSKGTNVGTGTLSGSGATASADSPNVNTATSVTGPLTPGRYCFRAEWPGDNHYTTALTEFGGATGGNECFTVQPIQTTTTTAPSVGSGKTTVFGSTVTDHAIVQAAMSGDGDVTGTVTFFVCDPTQTSGGTCPDPNGTMVGTSPVTLQPISGSSPPASSADSIAITANKTGTWCFRAVYTPATGSSYTGSSDATSDECFTVTDTTSAASQQNWLPNDTATVAAKNGAPLSGTLSAQLFMGTQCGADGSPAVPNQLYTKTLTNATSLADRTLTTTNGSFMVSSPGASFSWLITFTSKDPNVAPSQHCEVTTLTIAD